MPLSVFSRRRTASPVRELELTATQRRAVPRHFDAVAEALVAQRCPLAACAVAGSTLAADGVSLREALTLLSATHEAVGAAGPTFAQADSLSVSWSEETLAFLGDVSCEDPLTGLASAAHLRARITEIYRESAEVATSPRITHALVVVDLADPRGPSLDAFEQALQLASAAELAGTHFPGGATSARVGRDKLVIATRRHAGLGYTVSDLRAELQRTGTAPRARLWIEGLPDTPEAAVMVLSGLSLL